MSRIQVREVPTTRCGVREFMDLPEAVYAGDPHYVPPLRFEESKHLRNGPFEEIGVKRLLVAVRDGRVVARLSVHRSFAHERRHGGGTGFFGFFEAMDDAEAVCTLFDSAGRWLCQQGCTRVLGPLNFTIYEHPGILVDGFGPPALMCPYNPPYYADLLAAAGLSKEIDWYGYRFDQAVRPLPAMEAIARRVVGDPRYDFRQVDTRRRWAEQAPRVRQVFSRAWADNWGHVDFSDAQWKKESTGLRQAIVSALSWIVSVEGRPVAFSIATKDLNPALRTARGRLFPLGLPRILWHARRATGLRLLIMGVLPEYQGAGIDVALAHRTIQTAPEHGYTVCDCSQIVETNTRLLGGLDRMGGDRYRTFRIFGKTLDR